MKNNFLFFPFSFGTFDYSDGLLILELHNLIRSPLEVKKNGDTYLHNTTEISRSGLEREAPLAALWG